MSDASWAQLVSVALVGTERKPPPEAVVAEAAGLLGLPVERMPDELSVLRTAGTLAACRRAGLGAVHSDDAPPPPAPDDARPEASAAANGLFGLLLGGHVRVSGGPAGLIAEWLQRCAASGHRPPAQALPALLDHGSRSRDLCAVVRAAGGPRLAWLAAHNPAWSWAAAPEADDGGGDVWTTGVNDARMAHLAAVRAADPAAGLALVVETWAGEKAKDRAEIVAALGGGCGPDDEAFLEAALDDRATAVRVAAAKLLAGLPTSALAQRMTARVRPLVSQAGRVRRKLEVALPDEPDAAARRDGIVDHGAPPSVGRRTWWLIQLVGATPLALWPEPHDAVRQASQPELLDGWVIAAARQRDAAWSQELLGVRPHPSLLAALPPEKAQLAAIRAMEASADPAVPRLLAAVPGPWSPRLSAAVVRRLRAMKNAVAVETALATLSLAAGGPIVAEVEAWIGDLGPHDRLRHQLRQVAHALSIRQTIAEEFS